jgi:hypothetical protein
MRLSRPRNRPLALFPSDVAAHRFGALAVQPPWAVPGENAATILGSRSLACDVDHATDDSCMAATRPCHQIRRPRRLGSWRRVINVLCHDLPRPARPENISVVEREAMHLRGPGRARGAALASTDCRATPDAIVVFIDCDRALTKARCWSACRSPQRSVTRAVEPCRACQIGCSCTRCSSTLHLSARCTSVLASVYSDPGTSRGKGSGGAGKRHAGDGSRH